MSTKECSNCTFLNPSALTKCEMCSLPLTNNIDLEKSLSEALETIKKDQKIEENYKRAYDIIPESFFPVKMLYFNCSVNGFPTKAFIDTGAQITIMNYNFAKKIEMTHLIDTKFKGEAVGVGKQKIYGKIHLLDIELVEKGVNLPCSFTILKRMDIDIIFGLDMLLSHGIILDLRNKCMLIGDIIIKFV